MIDVNCLHTSLVTLATVVSAAAYGPHAPLQAKRLSLSWTPPLMRFRWAAETTWRGEGHIIASGVHLDTPPQAYTSGFMLHRACGSGNKCSPVWQ